MPTAFMIACATSGQGPPFGTTVVPVTGVLVPATSWVDVLVKEPVTLMSWMLRVQMCSHWQLSLQKEALAKTLQSMLQ